MGRYLIVAGLLLYSLISTAQEFDPYPPTAIPDRIMLNLTSSPSRSIAVTWRTALFVDEGFVEIAPADPTPQFTENAWAIEADRSTLVSDQNAAHYFSAIIDDLQPETTYAYRVGDSLHWSEWNQFTTASKDEKPFSFIYFGDAQNDIKSMWSRAIRGAFREMPKAQFMLHAGDLINHRNRDSEWGEWYYAGGWIYSMVPSIATPGNHEYGRDKDGDYSVTEHWNHLFTLPENGPGPKRFDGTTYYLDYENTRIISFDAPAFYRSEEDKRILVDWLTKVLQNNSQKWTVLTLHYPIYSTRFGRDNKELREAIQPLLQTYHVDLVLQGHDHTYGRGTNMPIGMEHILDGPMYVVSVSGPKMYDLGFDAWLQRAGSNLQLYQIITIDGNAMHYQAFTVDNQLYDAFELYKEDGHNLFFDLAPSDRQEALDLPPRYDINWDKDDLKDYHSRFKDYLKRKKSDKKDSSGN
ncbi:MAG: metallophosphoesterase family protein [Saprospiraceae bacterium]